MIQRSRGSAGAGCKDPDRAVSSCRPSQGSGLESGKGVPRQRTIFGLMVLLIMSSPRAEAGHLFNEAGNSPPQLAAGQGVEVTIDSVATAAESNLFAFYRDALGLLIRLESEHWSELSHADAIVALHGGRQDGFIETKLSFTVDDIEAACRRVAASGGSVRNPPRSRPGESLMLADLTDTEGNGFMLSQDDA